MNEIKVRQNRKSKIGKIEVSCYGEEMIMIDHPILSAPKPVGPSNPDRFWNDFDDGERAEKILDYLDAKIDWKESSYEILIHLGADIDEARQLI